ncbi:MAG: helix-turn-helix transcriptional regulator [Lachnospiraceae bacterium]|nr:helix-turn-helix transcriptional regulator [Lachnospiraceae bacterium]
MILAEKIISLRKRNGWSQEELADQMGISRQSVSKWESGASIPDLNKIIKMSQIFGVTTDYLLKDELEEIVREESECTADEEALKCITLEEANVFLDLTRKASKRIAGAVFFLILSPVSLILLGGLSEYKKIGITENMAGGMGTVILLLMIAISVSVLILNGMSLSSYEYLEKESVVLAYGVSGIVERQKEADEDGYKGCIVTGVVLCITAVVPLMLAAAVEAGDFIYVCCTALLLLLIACAVYLFIRTGMVHSAYDKLLQTGDYTREKKEINRKTSVFSGVYWCIVTAVYLAVSLPNHSWETSWVVWPVAGVLFAAVQGILHMVVKSENRGR